MKKVNVLILMTVLVLSSCKKSDLAKIPEKCKIVSVTDSYSRVTTYGYDLNGRISKIANTYILFDYYNIDGTFTYEPGVVTFTQNEGKYIILIDNMGHIIKDRILRNNSYRYNDEGYLVYKEFDYYSDVHKDLRTMKNFISYAKGNLVKVVADDSSTAIVTYYENEPSQNLLGFENALNSDLIFGIPKTLDITKTFIGKGSKNLVKTITKHISENNSFKDEITDTYTYLKDSTGKIIMLNINRKSRSGNNYSFKFDFAYQCP